jgi:hypothetical protein
MNNPTPARRNGLSGLQASCATLADKPERSEMTALARQGRKDGDFATAIVVKPFDPSHREISDPQNPCRF